METDEKGILTEAEIERMVDAWDRADKALLIVGKTTPFPTWEDIAPVIAQAQHQANIEKVEAVQNPIQGRVYGRDRDRQDAWDECQAAILRALRGG